MLPNSKLIKNLLNFGATIYITPNLIASAAINYSKIDGKGVTVMAIINTM